MSKKKKTLEELLEDALVSEDEQPFEIPENWVWTKLEPLVEYERGITFPASAKKESYEKGLIGCARTANIQDEFLWDDLIFVDEKYVSSTDKMVREKDILMSVSNSYHLVGKVSYIDRVELPITFGGFLMAIRVNKIESKYLFYYLCYLFGQGVLQKLSGQTTNIANLNSKKLNSLAIPIPPETVQRALIKKIDSLFSKINEAKQLIKEAKETFELRRAAILENAFHLFETEAIKQLKDVCKIKNGYAFKSKDFAESGYQLIRMGNLYKNKLDLSRNPVFIPKDYDEKLLEKYSVKNGDILLTLTGTKYKRDYGYAVKIENCDEVLLLNQRIMSLTPIEQDDYVFYYLQTEKFRNQFFSFETGGVNQGNVSSKAVSQIKIPWYDAKKRNTIVKIIKEQLQKEEKAFQLLHVEKVIEQIKQSILAKAFHGELLHTNSSNEERAIELLKSILQEKL